jgi:LacI family transcriptional regulator
MAQRPRVLIRHVAERAGVSVTTVSHVLNDVPGKRITPETRERVRRAAVQLGYAPNSVARSLRLQRTEMIALVSDEVATTPYAGRMILGAQETASKHGWLLMLVNVGFDAEFEAAEIEALRQRQVDGFLYAKMFHQQVVLPASLEGAPTVLLDAATADPAVPSVVPDEFGGGRTATRLLLEHGHTRVGFLNNTDDIPATRGRLAGYRAALEEAGLTADDRWVTEASSDTEGGLVAARRMLSRSDRPTALFCFNDRMAMGAYHAAGELGLRIPEDVSIVGFDDQELIASGLRPRLSTVALPHYEMGAWAVETLIRQVTDDSPVVARQVAAECPLVTRDSVAPPDPNLT